MCVCVCVCWHWSCKCLQREICAYKICVVCAEAGTNSYCVYDTRAHFTHIKTHYICYLQVNFNFLPDRRISLTMRWGEEGLWKTGGQGSRLRGAESQVARTGNHSKRQLRNSNKVHVPVTHKHRHRHTHTCRRIQRQARTQMPSSHVIIDRQLQNVCGA